MIDSLRVAEEMEVKENYKGWMKVCVCKGWISTCIKRGGGEAF